MTQRRNRRGTTLVELIVVITIIVIVVTALLLEGMLGIVDSVNGVIEGPGDPSVKAYNESLEEGIEAAN
jgi:prepilin-type N-terminal cleavage/methylation domain-containing protein